MSPLTPARRAASLWYASMHERRRSLARPTDRPVVRAGSDEPLRFLFVGNGLAHGWGVASHQLAPTGELARGLRVLTGRACEVEFVGDAAMSASTARQWLGGRIDHRFEGAVIAIGSNDAIRLTPGPEWAAAIESLLDEVRAGLPGGAPVLVVGIADVFVPGRARRLGPVARLHARRLDRLTEQIVERREDVSFLPAPSLDGFVGGDLLDLYGAFTAPMAIALIQLWRASSVDATASPAPERFDRADVGAIVEASRWEEIAGLAEIVRRARSMFGVSESAITLVDGDRSWPVASNGAMPVSMPRQLSYCETVVQSNAPLVVPDGRRDPRFASNPFLDLVHAPFYAGIPLRAADGEPIGALCLVNGFARSADTVDLDTLQELADEAQRIIRTFDPDRAPRDEEHPDIAVG